MSLDPQTPTSEQLLREGFARLRVAGHELTLYEETQPMIAAMLRDIRGAQRRVWVESYIIAADAAGKAIADALVECVKRGLDVRMIYDAVGCATTPGAYFNRLRKAGVQVHAYHTLGEALWRFSLLQVFNRRDHRKLLIVDDAVGYFGGMNIVDQSGIQTVEDVRARDLPSSAGWRDVHVRLVGPQQAELASAFERLWRRVHHLPRLSRRPWPIKRMLAAREDSLWFFDCRPSIKDHRAHRVLVPLIRKAKRNITLSMAYFIPIGRVLRELVKARRRGIKIRVIIPGRSDVPAVQWATRHFYAYLLARGFRIYERKDQMLHSKVMVIDDDWTVIGSCNIDPRSLRLNLEFLSVIRSRRLAAAVKRICHFEMKNSERVTLDHSTRRTWWQRILDRTAWSFRRWL